MDSTNITRIFEQELYVINLGLDTFADNLQDSGANVVHMDWKPPAGGDERLTTLLKKLKAKEETTVGLNVQEANSEAVANILKAKPVITGISTAGNVIPGMRKNLILHSGPPVSWENMCGPTRGAVIGGLIYEGMAENQSGAEALAASGEIDFEPCHDHSAVGPMAGIVTWSMPVWIVENQNFGNRAYCTLNEGLGKVLRYGAFSEEVISRLKWMADELAPILNQALSAYGELDMKSLISQALQMGDEGHNRNRAGTSLFIREIAPYLVSLDEDRAKLRKVLEFLNSNDHFFLNLTMPACKCTMDPAANIEGSSIITTMTRNGTEFGIRISGLADQWFTGPAGVVDGLYLPGYKGEDAARDMGDSVITETAGIGGFTMAGAPAIVKFVGGSVEDAVRFTHQMYEITLAENDAYQIPNLDFRGSPTGIDLLKVVETGILPVINTGIAHREPGVGMIGAGLVKPPENCFQDAFVAFANKYS